MNTLRTTSARVFLVLVLNAIAVHRTSAAQITDLYPDRSMYSPGNAVFIHVEAHNPAASTFKGKIDVSVYHLGHFVTRLAAQPLSIGPAVSDFRIFSWQPPSVDFRGYQLVAHIRDTTDAVVWTATSAVDVSSDWKRFPRYGYVSHYWWGLDSERTITSLKKYHINALQFYDWKWKHHVPYTPAASWPDIARRETFRATVTALLHHARNANMLSFTYNDFAAAYEGYQDDGSGATLSMGRFNDHPPSVHNQATWSLPDGWATPRLYLMNIRDPGWQQYIFGRTREVFDNLAFDGWHMDALIWDRWLRDYNGDWFYINDYIAPFVNAYRADMPDKRAIINTPDGEGAENIAQYTDVDVVYSELWGGSAHYIDFKHRVDTVRNYGSKATVFPAYMNSDVTHGFFNDNSVRLTAAAIFACGASQIAIGDGNEMLRTAYFPENNVKMSDTLRAAMRGYYSFLVAYQNLLRGDAVSADHAVFMEGTATRSDAQAGRVWTLAKKAPGYRIVHLVNLLHNWSTEWRDSGGHYPQPPTLEDRRVRVYLNAGVGSGTVWAASPDFNHGIATELPFTSGHDGGGSYVEVVLPRLQYWTMLWVEVNEPRSATGWFEAMQYDTKAGVDILDTSDGGGGWTVGNVKNTAGDSYVGYGHIDFGDGVAGLSARVASGLDHGEIEFRLHSPSGPAIATVLVGHTGGWDEWRTVTVPVGDVRGVHHLFAVFRHQAANLKGFEFEPLPPVGTVWMEPADSLGCEPVEILYDPAEGPLQHADPVYLHIGRNGWQNILSPSPAMHRREDGRWAYTYETPLRTKEIDVVFHDGAGTWDNNNSRDWHFPVASCGPPTVTHEPATPSACDEFITIRYDATERELEEAAQVYIHIGRNGWQDILSPSPAMTALGDNQWEFRYAVPPATDLIDFVFWDRANTWDNNDGQDWSIPLARCALLPSDAAFEVRYQGDAAWAFTFTNSLPGHVYDFHYSTNLVHGVWLPFGYDVVGDGTPIERSFTNRAAAIFFRGSIQTAE